MGFDYHVLLCSEPLWAQATDLPGVGSSSDSPPREVEEVIVRGRRLSDFRFEVEAARVRVYTLFDKLNRDDAFDVHCDVEVSTGTCMRQDICRAQFKDDIGTRAR